MDFSHLTIIKASPLLEITKTVDKLENNGTKPQESHEFKMTKPKRNSIFAKLSNLPGKWMMLITTL